MTDRETVRVLLAELLALSRGVVLVGDRDGFRPNAGSYKTGPEYKAWIEAKLSALGVEEGA